MNMKAAVSTMIMAISTNKAILLRSSVILDGEADFPFKSLLLVNSLSIFVFTRLKRNLKDKCPDFSKVDSF